MMLGSGPESGSPERDGAAPSSPATAKALRAAAAAPAASFPAQLRTLLETPEGSQQRVDEYMNLLNVSRNTDDTAVPGLFAVPDFPLLLDTIARDIKKDGQSKVTHCAIRCGGFFCHYGDQAPAPLHPFQDVLNSIVLRGRQAKANEDRVTLTLCIWFLGAQRLHAKQVRASISPIMELIVYGMEIPVRSTTICAESCTALTTLFAQTRQPVLAQARLWVIPALMHLVHPEETVQSRAEALFQVLLVDEKPGAIEKSLLDDFVKTAPTKFVPDLEKLSDERALRAWKITVAVCGPSMHRTATLNVFLKIIEKYFNSKEEAVKSGAYAAWIYLIYSFTAGEHLLHEKRLTLIMTPYLECLRNRREPTANKLNVVKDWIALLYVVGSNVTKFAPKLLFDVLRVASKYDPTVEDAAFCVMERYLESPAGSFKAAAAPDPRRLLIEPPIEASDLVPLDPKFICTHIAQFAEVLDGLLAAESTEVVKPTAARYWQALLSCVSSQARLELSMSPDVQGALDGLISYVAEHMSTPRRTPLSRLKAQSFLFGILLSDMTPRVLAMKPKSDAGSRNPAELLKTLLAMDSHVPNPPRLRSSPLISVMRAWVALPKADEDGEAVILELFAKILDIGKGTASLDFHLAVLAAIEDCPVEKRRLRLWSVLAHVFAQQIRETSDVFSEEDTFHEVLAALLFPLRHANDFRENSSGAWLDLWSSFWDTARVKQRNPSNALEQVLERVAAVEPSGPCFFDWSCLCYQELLRTMVKDVSGNLVSARKRSMVSLIGRQFFLLLDEALEAPQRPDVTPPLMTAATLCVSTLSAFPDLLADNRFRVLDTVTKMFHEGSGVTSEKLEELVTVCAEAYEKNGVADSRERLSELGAIIKLVNKSKTVRPQIGPTLERILKSASPNDVPMWLRKQFSLIIDAIPDDDVSTADDRLLSSAKKQSRFSLASKIKAAKGGEAKGSDVASHPVSEPWVPPAQADTQDFVPIPPIISPVKRPAAEDQDSQEERRRKRKASIPNLYNSLDHSQELLPLPGPTPASEAKRRKMDAERSPASGLGDREENPDDMPTSPTSARRVSAFRGIRDEEPPVLERPRSPAESEAARTAVPRAADPPHVDAVVAAYVGADGIESLVEKVLNQRNDLELLDQRSLILLHKKVSMLAGAVMEALEKKMAA
ncbi:Rap1-interacting factor 1 N terminal-domain-containing protein [Hyaloraphidium curvatum]|nr:Rap1-interacting factor 1 N terminal-domain-containing protein [Hyaloraphidium curvatum]